MSKKIFSKVILLALVASVFMVPHLVLAGLTPSTSTNVSNDTPVLGTPSDGGSSATAPTNVGSNVTFTATATDANGDQYRLIICKNGSAPTPGLTPECNGGASNRWALSAATNSGVQASATYIALLADAQTNDWYAFACDYLSSGSCSAPQQGSGDTGSPFHVNHAPTFGTVLVGDTTGGTGLIHPTHPTTDTVYFHLNADGGVNGIDDNDNDTTQDTVRVYICNAATTGMTTPGTCTGGTLICSQSTPFDPNTTPFECSSASIMTPPVPHGAYNYKIFVFDSHDFAGTGTTSQSFTVQNTPPYIVDSNSYTVSDINTIPSGGSVDKSYSLIVKDDNGDTDLTGTTAVLYNTGTETLTGGTCTGGADENECYILTGPSTCTLSNQTGADVDTTATCNFTAANNSSQIWFNALPNAAWKLHANPTDGTPVTDQASSNNILVIANAALDIPEGSIAYGVLALGTTSTIASENTVTLQNKGNVVFDMLISGTSMCTDAPTCLSDATHTPMLSTQQRWRDESTTFGSTFTVGHQLQTSATAGGSADQGCSDRDLAIRTTHTGTGLDQSIYWRIQIPSTDVLAGSYTGTNTFATTTISCTTTGE